MAGVYAAAARATSVGAGGRKVDAVSAGDSLRGRGPVSWDEFLEALHPPETEHGMFSSPERQV